MFSVCVCAHACTCVAFSGTERFILADIGQCCLFNSWGFEAKAKSIPKKQPISEMSSHFSLIYVS